MGIEIIKIHKIHKGPMKKFPHTLDETLKEN